MISKNAIKRALKKSKRVGTRIFRKEYSRIRKARKFAFDRLRKQLDGMKKGQDWSKNAQWQKRTLQRRKALAEKKIAHKMLQSVSRQKGLTKDIHRAIAQFL